MPQVFTNREYADMHFICGFCNGNARAATREYQRRFPGRRAPDYRVFIHCHRHLLTTGSFESCLEGN
ncbi:uncharacterized protein LOC143362438 [Halictus rubicundus]|uniref:uncharacterized protein LOC143362438 n=1 Tax=Halictus rubicundus TaxID=77578 RepID=UPI004036800B